MIARHSVFRRIAAGLLAGLALAGPGACARTPRPIPVLMYHGLAADPGHDVWTVATDEFRRQVADLKAAKAMISTESHLPVEP